MNRNQKEICQ